MPDTLSLADLLRPELEQELAITRRFLVSVPDGLYEYAPHEKSMKFARLVSHIAEAPEWASMPLTTPRLNLAEMKDYKSPDFESGPQIAAIFDEKASALVATVKAMSNETFGEPWTMSFGEHLVFQGTRYDAYRTWGLNHMIHHRAQLGTYLRLNGHKVPATYGPSADEQ